MTFRRVDIADHRPARLPASTGLIPELQWVRIDQLAIDDDYQRPLASSNWRAIKQIAENFTWAHFSPLIVAPLPDAYFAIIDGQHRVTGAALCGRKEVPCQVITADRRQQAEAFAAVNGNVTPMTSLQLHAARVASGEPRALALAQACGEADVTICRYPVPGNKMKPGETLAVGVLMGLLDKFGRDVFVAALSCITKTRRGNPGMIRAQIVDALCSVLEAEPNWYAELGRLIFAMQTFDFAEAFNAARAASVTEGGSIGDALVDSIGAHLEEKLAVTAT